jgi:actin-related protein
MDNVVVVDMGCYFTKAGWAGDDIPQVITPSKTSTESQRSHDLFTLDPTRNEEIDWGKFENLWNKTFLELGLDSVVGEGHASSDSSHCPSFLIAVPPNSTPFERRSLANLLFDTFRVPSICIANSSVLSIFATGRTTGTVVQCGGGSTSSVPVFEGM